MKKLLWLFLILFILLLFFVLNILLTTGFFRTVQNSFEGIEKQVIAVNGAEDLTIATIDSFAIISSTDRSVYPPKSLEKGNLFYMDLTKDSLTLQSLSINLPINIAPHGISLYKAEDHYLLAAINHQLGKHTIEMFRLDSTKLSYIKTITHSSLVSPNDIVLVDEEQFYFTNDHGYTKGLGRFMEEYGGMALANVVYFDGSNFIEVADGIAYANGINIDPKRSLLYVAAPRKFQIRVYKILDDGRLEFIESIKCGTGVDNIEIDKQGILWVGGHPNLLEFAAYAKGNKKIAPSEILKIEYRGKSDYTVESIYTNDGSQMSGCSVASYFDNKLLVGNVKDSKMLVLHYPN